MTNTIQYPISETQPERLWSPTGRRFEDLTMESVLQGTTTIDDFAITPNALLMQAAVARRAARITLAENFERAAELVSVPDDVIFATYELLRPGRAASATELISHAEQLRVEYGASRIATFVEEAAQAYQRRSLFRSRY